MSIKLLVADDSITIQKVIGIIFGNEEYSLTIVDNGKSAIEKAREICPDVLLIDALMPGMTGYEVAEAVRATPSIADKPILILTGSFEPFDEEKAKKCGADDFLAKPFESQQIVNKVRELAELGASRERAAIAVQTPVAPVTPATPVIPTFADTPTATVLPQQSVTPQAFDSSDIWGAFTTETESPVSRIVESSPSIVTQTSAPFEFAAEPDVFAIVNEESNSQLIQPAAAPVTSPQKSASQWAPVEEYTFEFEEETVSDNPVSAPSVQTPPTADFAFGDIAFEDDEPLQPSTLTSPAFVPAAETTQPASITAEPSFISFDEPPAAFTTQAMSLDMPAEPVQPAVPAFVAPPTSPVADIPAAVPVPAALTEDQLRAAISAASKEVIERIVWEIVPDLAEVLIKEAIRKIKDGQ